MDETRSQVVVEVVGPGKEMERISDDMSELGTKMVRLETKSDVDSEKEVSLRAEIDTSAPFESVKEAVTRFGGVGYWKPTCNKLLEHQHETEEVSIEKIEEQASQLENDLILKQRETLDILQQLESTRTFVEELKAKLQKAGSETTSPAAAEDDEAQKENNGYPNTQSPNVMEGLVEAQQNLTKTTNGIAEIRASIEVFNKKLERERVTMEKISKRLAQNSLRMSSIEEQLNQTMPKLQVANVEHGTEILKELQNLNSEAEKFRKMGEAAKSELRRTISKIERKKAKITSAETRLAAAVKKKEAARVNEGNAMTVLPNHEILREIREATKEMKSTKQALEEAVKSMEGAKKERVAVEEALQKWRGKNYENRRLERCESAVVKPTLSIGQILSRKLFLQEELMSAQRSCMKQQRKVSLAQMLGKQNGTAACGRKESDQRQCTRKRKKSSGFARFSLFLTNQKRKKPTPNLK